MQASTYFAEHFAAACQRIEDEVAAAARGLQYAEVCRLTDETCLFIWDDARSRVHLRFAAQAQVKQAHQDVRSAQAQAVSAAEAVEELTKKVELARKKHEENQRKADVSKDDGEVRHAGQLRA